MAKKKIDTKKSNSFTAQNAVGVRLESINFSEFLGESLEWILPEVSLGRINLIVGKNSSGKSRLLSVIAGLANMLTGKNPKVYLNGNYHAVFSKGSLTYTYSIDIADGEVKKEKLIRDEDVLLDRGAQGIGKIWAEKISQFLDFETPSDQLAAKARRDTIQHPFFEDLHNWAGLLRHYEFGTSLGRDRLLMVTDVLSSPVKTNDFRDAADVIRLYNQAFAEHGKLFDDRILTDLRLLGYDCTDVGSEVADSSIVKMENGPPLVWLFVQERGLKAKTGQLQMSQGMFRAVSLVIHLNYCVLQKLPRTLLIDDIGEGLDFSRAKVFIALLIKHSEANGLQLIMTSNDRFVMNGVPLEYWGVMTRTKSKVSLLNIRNSPKVFEDFKDLGLNNFDFFSTEFFEGGLQ